MVRNNILFISIIFFLIVLFGSFGFISAANCWTYNTSAACSAADYCKWKNDSWSANGWCEELNCWTIGTQSSCNGTAVPGKNCSWQGGGTSYTCEKLSCWGLTGTNQTTCENNAAGLNCQWSGSCWWSGYVTPGVPSPNCYQQNNQSSCQNVSGCTWGQCNDKQCWGYSTDTTCNAAKDYNGKNCTWNANGYCEQNGCYKYYNQSNCTNPAINKGLNCQWKYNSCQDVDCYSWDFTNATACINNTANLSCSWSGSYCNKQDCWSYNTQSTCQNKSACLWKAYTSSGWCQEVQCYTWDSYNGGNQTACVNNSYGLSCSWTGNPPGNTTGGWCFKNMASVSCSNFTTERACMDTFYCWWQYTDWNNPTSGGTCSAPGSFGGGVGGVNTSILNDWNPGCYIFDMNASDCNRTLGCNYSTDTSKCLALSNDYGLNITANGINCSYINDSTLCNNIPVLASCCSWQNSSCTANKLSSVCRDQVTAPPIGAAFCEDYNSYVNQALCNQIAGNPWYMPCQWDNSTSRCKFKASDIFGNDTQSLVKIDNKKNCEAAGGKWVTENYCEGNISVPAGRCEYKFDDEDNCDKACFACEKKDSNGNSINATNAESACMGSKLGICEFSSNTAAPNGIGYCKAKEQFKKGVAGNCDSNCGDCTYKGDPNNNDTTKRPSYYCTNSKANNVSGGCKWITDNSTTTGGYCADKGEKTCEDSCDRCATQTTCSNNGRTSISNKTGSCKWQGSATSGNCVANIGQEVEICWDGIDNNNNTLSDCADPGCYADSYCGLVSGDCFGWTTNASCVDHSCEWVTDKWGSWCDFKGSQCWKYNQNVTVCNVQTNCQWSNGTGVGTASAWCEKDMGKQEECMGKAKTACLAASGSGCNWTADIWCNGTGSGTTWCSAIETAGWCDNSNFKPKDCWRYSASSNCNSASGCSWKTDQYSQPHCEVNWSANCWQYTSNATCSDVSECIWDVPTYGTGNGWCMNKADKCWSYGDSASCNVALGGRCYWQSWGSGGSTSGGSCQSICWNSSFNSNSTCSASLGCNWKAENGWCEESAMSSCSNVLNMNNVSACQNTTGCRWKTSGWCDPKSGGFSGASNAAGGGLGSAMGGDCFKYDGNQSLCTNQSKINISCGWTVNPSPSCEVNWGVDCWRYASAGAGGCNVTNGCWFKNDSYGSYCTNIMDQCLQNVSYQSWSNSAWQGNCTANYLCTNNSWGGCEPRCSSLTINSCTNSTYIGKCSYTNGWCNPKGMNDMFTGMEAGSPVPLGVDAADNSTQASVDIIGYGLKDMGDSYGLGAGVRDFSNASVCNKEILSSFVMTMAQSGGGYSGFPGTGYGQERIGNGNETVIYIVYLDTDGSQTGGCTLTDNSSATGYEFRFKYSSQWNINTSKAVETFNAYKCDDSSWKTSDIKLSTWKQKMCSDIGGPMIAVKKADLAKYPTLYDSTKDIRVYIATIGNTGDISNPTDTCGPGWTTPGSFDFEIKSAFEYGADSAKFEDILKKGFVQGEDCFNSIDDDNDGNVDCTDWDCQYSSKCSGLGVNAANYSDTSSPLVTGVKIEEYPDAVLIMYDTNKPTNGTLEWYGADSQCINSTSGEPGKYIFPDIGIVKNTTIRAYKLWHVAALYNGATKLNSTGFAAYNAPLVNNVNSYYKLKVCDSNGKCSISKCSSFKLPVSSQKCGYCNFVTRIKVSSDWTVSYDVNRDGTYEHIQGQVCGPNAGMKTNYTDGRRVNIKLAKSDGSIYIEFLNASLTKTGLNDKVRTISSSGDMIHDTTKGIVGLSSETRDKIINNLHPEACRIKIPIASGTVCNTLYHCDDNGENCTDRTAAAGGSPIDAVNCVWNVPYCEFSTYKGSAAATSSSSSSSGGGGGGGGGGSGGKTYSITDIEFNAGFSKELAKNDKIIFALNKDNHTLTLTAVSASEINISVSSTIQKKTIALADSSKFELNGDNYYDLLVRYDSYALNKAKITVMKISALISSSSITGEAIEETPAAAQETPASEEQLPTAKSSSASSLFWIIGIILVVIVIGIVFYIISSRR